MSIISEARDAVKAYDEKLSQLKSQEPKLPSKKFVREDCTKVIVEPVSYGLFILQKDNKGELLKDMFVTDEIAIEIAKYILEIYGENSNESSRPHKDLEVAYNEMPGNCGHVKFITTIHGQWVEVDAEMKTLGTDVGKERGTSINMIGESNE